MYFAISGQNQAIAEKELSANGFQFERIKKNIALLEKDPQNIKRGSIIKAGRLINIEDIKKTDIIGTNNKDLWKFLKKTGTTRRFKMVELDHQDKEVREHGKEIIIFEKIFNENKEVAEVTYYQDIPVFETVDFEKPASGMNVGMMPAKLCLSLINIATGLKKQSNIKQDDNVLTIYDPFVWFWTTSWLTNHLGYNTIASDISITAMKQNIKRRKWHKFSTEKPITVFKHDVKEPFQKSFLKNVDCIVSEWWLWPIQKKVKPEHEAKEIQERVLDVYKGFFRNAKNFFNPGTVIVCTIPFYLRQETNIIFTQLERLCYELEISIESVEEIYKRNKQFVWRQIVIVKL